MTYDNSQAVDAVEVKKPRVALCFKGTVEELVGAPANGVAHEFQMVDRDICEKSDSGYLQILPYGTFATFTPNFQHVRYISYSRPSKGEGEARLKGKNSLGFGGHLDQASDIGEDAEYRLTESGDKIYSLTSDQLLDVCRRGLLRELREELGYDFPAGFLAPIQPVILREDADEIDDVGKVHVCVSFNIGLTPDTFDNLFMILQQQANEDKLEVEGITTTNIKVGEIVMDFNLVESRKTLADNLTTGNWNFESWSVLVVLHQINTLVGNLQKYVSLADMVAVMMHKIQAQTEQAAAEEAANEEATEAAADAKEPEASEATETVAEPTAEVSDVETSGEAPAASA